MRFRKVGIVAGPVEEAAPVELDDPGGQPAQEHPVVGDEDQRRRRSAGGSPPASGSPRCRGGWSARRAGGCRARRRGPGPAGRAASSPRRGPRTGRRGRAPSGRGSPRPGGRRRSAAWPASSSSSPAATSSATVPPAALGDLLGQPGDPQALLADDLPLVGLRARPGSASAACSSPRRCGRGGRADRPVSTARATPSRSRGPPKARLTSRRLNNAMNDALDLSSRPPAEARQPSGDDLGLGHHPRSYHDPPKSDGAEPRSAASGVYVGSASSQETSPDGP